MTADLSVVPPANSNADKLTARLAAVYEAAQTAGGDNQQTFNALADCERALRRIVKRAESLSGEWERIEIRQMRGPVIEFTGRMLCDTTFTTMGRDALEITLEIWETRSGSLIAVSASNLPNGEGREDERAAVIPKSDDVMAMRCAVMDHFTWHTEAKKMVRKKLAWDLRVEVD